MPSDHELLGIGPDAGPAEVRAAYIAALRRLHPDSGGSAGDAQKVSELVGAYRRLRGGKRRRISLTPMTVPTEPRPARPVWWAGLALLVLIAAAVALAALILLPRRDLPRSWPDPAPSTEQTDSRTALAEPDEGSVRQAVGMLQSFDPRADAQAVEDHSRSCFSELEGQPDLRLLDYCLAFDLAATRSRAFFSRPEAVPGYFRSASLAARQSGALERLVGTGPSARIRLARIDTLVQTALGGSVSFGDPLFGPR